MHNFLRKRAFRVGFVVFACALALAGCGMPGLTNGHTPSPSPAITDTPTPEAAVPTDEDLAFGAHVAFGETFRLNYDQYDTEQDIETFTELMELRHLFTGMADDYEASVAAAADAALARVREYEPDATLALTCPKTDWRFMVSLCCDCAEDADDKLIRLSEIETSYADGVLRVTVTLPCFEAFFANEALSVRYDALTVYCYLNTVYDENGNETDSDGSYTFPEGYAEGLVEPLPKRYIKDGWYNDRSNATRRHMGTDITAPEGRIIHS
ncbi:MAG TPA: hypothetical protein VN540_03795, partial [Clostridia bacterium]|nr:hypothetical protein [Clostridia bacterium]